MHMQCPQKDIDILVVHPDLPLGGWWPISPVPIVGSDVPLCLVGELEQAALQIAPLPAGAGLVDPIEQYGNHWWLKWQGLPA